MKQSSFASSNFTSKKKQGGVKCFSQSMKRMAPWEQLKALILPYHPAPGRRGWQPMGLSTILRTHFMQQWYALSDPAMEDALCKIKSMRWFAGLEWNGDAIADETSLLKFRRLSEQHKLAQTTLDTLNAHVGQKQLMLRQGTIVAATIIHTPSSTKNQDKTRDPEMHQTKKGSQYYFGM